MKNSFRIVLLALVVFCLTSTVGSSPALAYFKHHHGKHTKHVHHKTLHKKHIKSDPMVHDAQNSLIRLQFLKGHADGVMGPKTIKAIKDFQLANNLPVTGKLTRDVYNAIIKADKEMMEMGMPVIIPPVDPQVGLVGPTNQQYADPLLGGAVVAGAKGQPQYARTQELLSRFAKLDVNENTNGNMRRYAMTVNGSPVLEVDGQPSIIGISPTYNLNDEDGIILTTYNEADHICHYKHFLLLLSNGRNELKEFGDCTQGYQARNVENSLFVTFPQVDDKRVVGATWRYESGDLEKL